MRIPSSIVRRTRTRLRQQNSRRLWRRSITLCRAHLLLSLTITSVFIGLLTGFMLRGMNVTQETVRLINFPGEIFMQVLKLMILPLIFSSLVSALAQMDARESGQMSLLTVGYYVITTLFATMTGVLLVLLVHPGDPSIKQDLAYMDVQQHHPISPLDTFLDVVRNMFPENVVQATMQRVQTKYFYPAVRVRAAQQTAAVAASGGGGGADNTNFSSSSAVQQQQQQQQLQHRKKIEYVHGVNILGIIVFCTGFGIVISQLGERARIIVEFFIILEAVIMQLVAIFMWLTPLGIVSLIAGNLLELGDLSDTAAVLLLYILTVLSGLGIHTLLTMPFLYFLFTRRNPLKIVHGMFQALVTAFGTASGGAALPVSMRCMEENLHVDRRIARFVLPLGSTINMDGNALYEAVAVIFIAQLNNVTLTMAEVITVSFIATIASLGLNSVPAGLVSIFVILSTVGLPIKDIPLIITADWLLDRIRTCINVLGDAFVASTVSHYLADRLQEADRHNEFHQQTQREEAELLGPITVTHHHHAMRQQSICHSEGDAPTDPAVLKAVTMLRGGGPGGYATVAGTAIPSRHHSVDSQVISWKEQAILERLRANVKLHRVMHI